MIVFLTTRSLSAAWADLLDLYGGRLQRMGERDGVIYQGPGKQSERFRIVQDERGLKGLRFYHVEVIGPVPEKLRALAEAMAAARCVAE